MQRGKKLPPPPVTVVDMLEMHAYFSTKFYTTVQQENIHFITKFCFSNLKMTKLCSFNQDNAHSSAFEHHAELNELSWVH